MSDEAIRKRIMCPPADRAGLRPIPELKLSDLSDMRKVMEAAGWTYVGVLDNGIPLFAQRFTGEEVIPVSTPQFVPVSTCTICGHRVHIPGPGLGWTTLARDGYTTYCEESLDQLHHADTPSGTEDSS